MIPFPNIATHGASQVAKLTISKQIEDIQSYREKCENFDSKIRMLATSELNRIKKENISITSDEALLLEILINHQQPRKQLYWALHAKVIYQNLKEFLELAKIEAKLVIPGQN